MDIFLLTPDNPFPSASGAALRNYGIIRGLHGAGHSVDLLTFADVKPDEVPEPLSRYCRRVDTAPMPKRSKFSRVLNLLASSRADIEFRLASGEFLDKLGELMANRRYDVIQFSGIELGCALRQIRAQKRDAKVVYDALNAEAELQALAARIDRQQISRLLAALYSSVQARRIKRFEREICKSVDAVVAVSEEDREHLWLDDGAPVYLMPNGISVAEYIPPSDNERAESQLVFTGKMDYRPNVDAIEWFCGGALPIIRRAHPSSQLLIVGRNPHRRILALSARREIAITGWVDAVQPYLHAATVFIVPLRMGSGTRLKILEAMAAGCAVVSTTVGASGLHRDLRKAMIIADDVEAFARAVISLLADVERRRELGEMALQAVQKHHDWSSLIPHLLRAYEDIGIG